MTTEIVIASAARTPIGSFNGAFGAVPAHDLGKVAIALGVVSSAYMAETLRAGIQAVPRGQIEAARALGMSPTRNSAS